MVDVPNQRGRPRLEQGSKSGIGAERVEEWIRLEHGGIDCISPDYRARVLIPPRSSGGFATQFSSTCQASIETALRRLWLERRTYARRIAVAHASALRTCRRNYRLKGGRLRARLKVATAPPASGSFFIGGPGETATDRSRSCAPARSVSEVEESEESTRKIEDVRGGPQRALTVACRGHCFCARCAIRT